MDVSPVEFQGPVPPERLHGRDELLDDLTRRVTELTVAPQRLLRLLAHSQPPYGANAEQLGLTPGSATNARKQLTRRGHVSDDGTLVDPLFADGFRRTPPLT